MTFLSFLLVVMTFWHLRYKKMKTSLPSNVASSGNVQPCSSSTSSEHGSRLTYIIRDLSSLYLTSLRSSISYDPFSCSRCITISITIGNNLIYYSIICKISGIYASTMCGIFFFFHVWYFHSTDIIHDFSQMWEIYLKQIFVFDVPWPFIVLALDGEWEVKYKSNNHLREK